MNETSILREITASNDTSSNNDDETFNQFYSRFLNKNTTDVATINGRRLLRSNVRDFIINTHARRYLESLTSKNCPINNISSVLFDPFELLDLTEKTEVQIRAEKNFNKLNRFGSYCYNCSCGSGKTLVGMYYMFRLQCKTLIISSRNAINDQWKRIIEKIYPNLVIQCREGKYVNRNKYRGSKPTDIWIVTPQYLASKVDEFDFNPSLIIYDELHSLLSDKFVKVLMFPFLKVMKKELDELPYMIGLSATIPNESTSSYNIIKKVFGTPIRTDSSVTKIPVNLWDYYDHYKEDKGNPEVMRGSFDTRYNVPSDSSLLKKLCNMVDDNKEIDPTSTSFKGIIMCHTINASVYAALYVHKRWKCNVLLMRTVNESNIYIRGDEYQDFDFDVDIELKTLLDNHIGELLKGDSYFNVLEETSIIIGTEQRLKEGFNVENITWGICMKFVWSKIARVQMLGRIRRASKDEELNRKPRFLYVCSGRRPSNISAPRRYGPPRFSYDIELEKITFQMENYVRI